MSTPLGKRAQSIWRRTIVGLAILATAGASQAFGLQPARAAVPLPLQTLSPGEAGYLVAPLRINVVFVGYDGIDMNHFRDGLAPETVSIVRRSLNAGVLRTTHNVSLLDYRTVVADAAFDDAFFGQLATTGRRIQPTRWQQLYNREPQRTLDVTEVLAIDAPSTERWLADNAGPRLGVDTRRPTVFLVNWFGRPDFRFHIYTRIGAIDTDTGVDIGSYDSRSLIAWGGTPSADARRVWFHDLSAGPDFLTRNFDLTNVDLDGDGVLDYRLPPVWEYGNLSAYRPFTDLAGDLAKVVRYVATDTLFAPSPYYNPAISAPKLPSTISIDVNRFTAPGMSPASIAPAVTTGELAKLQPWNQFRMTQRNDTYDGLVADAERCYTSAFLDPAGVGHSCYGKRGNGFAAYDMFFYTYDHLAQLTAAGTDHSVPVVLFEVPNDTPLAALGFAEPNLREPEHTQFHVLEWTSPQARAFGIGPTDVLTHEMGHHLGLSHPHDGLDYWSQRSFVASGSTHFASVGDESATVMSYSDHLATGFSQFDLDSMARWMTAGFLNEGNQVLAEIVGSPRSHQVDAKVQAADQAATQALRAYFADDWRSAAFLARDAYTGLLAAAAAIKVPIEPEAGPADAKSRSLSAYFSDPVAPEDWFAPPKPGHDRTASFTAPQAPSTPGWVIERR